MRCLDCVRLKICMILVGFLVNRHEAKSVSNIALRICLKFIRTNISCLQVDFVAFNGQIFSPVTCSKQISRSFLETLLLYGGIVCLSYQILGTFL